MTVAFRAASGGQSSTAALAASVTQPAGAVTGDMVIVGLDVKDAQTFTAKTGWTLEQNANSNSNVSTTATFRRVLDGTESWPISFAWTGSSVKFAWVAAAFSPTSGNLMTVDGEAAVKVDTTATTHTANSQAAVAASVCSVIFNCHRNSGSTATGTTVTPPTNWTEPANGDQTTASGATAALAQVGVEVCYRTGQSGTVTPGSCTLSQTGTQNTYHFLLTDIAPETSPSLTLSGFGSFTGVHNADTVNSLAVAYTHKEASSALAPTLQLWDGTSAQIGATLTGTVSATVVTDTFTLTGANCPTFAQLGTLQVRVFGNGYTGSTESADAVGLTVNYTPAAILSPVLRTPPPPPPPGRKPPPRVITGPPSPNLGVAAGLATATAAVALAPVAAGVALFLLPVTQAAEYAFAVVLPSGPRVIAVTVPAAGTSAAAGLATGTAATALPAASAIGVTAGLATGTSAAALIAAPALGITAGLATGTGAAQAAPMANANPGLASGTGAARAPTAIAIGVTAGLATGTSGTAQPATVTIAVTATAGLATGTSAAALIAAPAVAPTAGAAGAVTISVVQFKTFAGGVTGSFTSNVTTGNSIILWIFGYNTNSSTITSSSPLYNGSAVTGAAQLFQLQNSSGFPMYTSIWLLPNVATSGTSVSYTLANSFLDPNQGWAIAEVAGLGATPSLDAGAAPNPATGSNPASANPSSGSTGSTTSAPELIVGGFMTDGSPTGPGTPWTTMAPNGFCSAGYQIVTSAGGAYTYSGTSGSVQWSAGVAAIMGTAATGTAQAPSPAVGVTAGLATGTGTALNATVSTSGGTNANAGLATATGTALAATPAVGVTAGLATATGTALIAGPAAGVTAGLATATGTALLAGPAVGVTAGLATAAGTALLAGPAAGVTAGLATATGTALLAGPAVGVTAGLATATGTALNASVSTSGNTNANAGLATATGTAQTAAPAAGVTAGLATAAGTAQSAPLANANPGLAAGTGTALAAAPAVGVTAGLAQGTGTAQNAAAGAVVTANAGLATGTAGAAQAAAPAIGVTAGLAQGTGTAQPVGQSASITAGLATGTAGAALNATVAIAVTASAGLATGTAGAAQAPASIATGVTAGFATGTGSVPTALFTRVPGFAAATGTALAPAAVSVSITAGLATATGTALGVTATGKVPDTKGSSSPGGVTEQAGTAAVVTGQSSSASAAGQGSNAAVTGQGSSAAVTQPGQSLPGGVT